MWFSSRWTSFLLQQSKSDDQLEVRSFCGFLCPPSFITPFTVNELSSSTPLSFSMSSVVVLGFFFLSTEGLNFVACPWARFPPPHIVHCVPSPPPLVICLTPSKSQRSALGRGKKTVSKLCLIRMTVHLFRHLPHKTRTRAHTSACAHYLKPASTCCDITTLRRCQQNDELLSASSLPPCVCVCTRERASVRARVTELQIGSARRSP